MKMREAIGEVWKRDVALLTKWLTLLLTKQNVHDLLVFIGGVIVVFWPWAPIAYWYVSQSTNPFIVTLIFANRQVATLFVLCCSIASCFWTYFWLRVLGKWFDSGGD